MSYSFYLKPTWTTRAPETSLVWNSKIALVLNLVLLLQPKAPYALLSREYTNLNFHPLVSRGNGASSLSSFPRNITLLFCLWGCTAHIVVILLLLWIYFAAIYVTNKSVDNYSIKTKFAIGDAELSETKKELLSGYFSDIAGVIVMKSNTQKKLNRP